MDLRRSRNCHSGQNRHSEQNRPSLVARIGESERAVGWGSLSGSSVESPSRELFTRAVLESRLGQAWAAFRACYKEPSRRPPPGVSSDNTLYRKRPLGPKSPPNIEGSFPNRKLGLLLASPASNQARASHRPGRPTGPGVPQALASHRPRRPTGPSVPQAQASHRPKRPTGPSVPQVRASQLSRWSPVLHQAPS